MSSDLSSFASQHFQSTSQKELLGSLVLLLVFLLQHFTPSAIGVVGPTYVVGGPKLEIGL